MAGVQIFSEAPISSVVEKDAPTTTSSAAAPQPAPLAPAQPPAPSNTSSAAFAPQPQPFPVAEPSINPPTPAAATFPPAATSSYAPLMSTSQPLPPPQRSGSLTPSVSESPLHNVAGGLEAPAPLRSRSASPRRDIPPPPKVGEKMKPPSYYSPAATPTYGNPNAYTQPFPQQGNTPNTATFAQQQGLLSPNPSGLFSPAAHHSGQGFTASPAQTPTTATIPAFQGQSQQQSATFEHPPGYVQNPYAADMTPEQRFASQHGAKSPTLGYGGTPSNAGGFSSPNPFASFASSNNGAASPGVSTGGGRGGILDNGNDDGSVWGMVSGWAKTAGKKLSEAEGEVWKRINRDQ